jgi:hypothetical protein
MVLEGDVANMFFPEKCSNPCQQKSSKCILYVDRAGIVAWHRDLVPVLW